MKLNTLDQSQKTKKFLDSIKTLLNNGVVKNYSEVIKELGWEKTMLSNVMNGRRNVPNDIYRKFTEVYNLEGDVKGVVKHDTPTKDIQLREAVSLINDQSATNKALAIAQKDLAAAQKDIAAVNLKLTTMLEVSKSSWIPEDISLILEPHLQILVDALASRFSLSADDLQQEMDKILVSAHLKKKVSGNHSDAHR